MVKLKTKECGCGSYEYSISFNNLGDAHTECFCPFCGAQDEAATEALERSLKKRREESDE